MIGALVVEDSGLMRIRISDVLRSDGNIKVVGTAKNGAEGLAAIKEKQPDVVITDMMMPEYDGLYLVKKAMKEHPVPIIVLSSLGRNNMQVFEALSQGAFEFLDKPRSPRGLGFNKPLINLVKAAAKANIPNLPKQRRKSVVKEHDFSYTGKYDIVVVGASTGGPGAIERLLEELPENFPVPIVIAQHMPAGFIESFALRLDNICHLRVKVAELGEIPEPGTVYICPGDQNTNLVVNPTTGMPQFGRSKKTYKEFNEPSVDCLFESVAEVFRDRAIGTVLTGMGRDGTAGLTLMKKAGALAVSQEENSCVVYGMPKSAYEAKIVDHVVHINKMAEFISTCLD